MSIEYSMIYVLSSAFLARATKRDAKPRQGDRAQAK
jgi:hypothetical protein